MALVVLCGQPCSGKSLLAAKLKELLEKDSNTHVILIDEPSLNISRNDDYQDMNREKNVRSLLRSAVDREVMTDKIVIVDSLNNIKGYRYELWCIARAAAIKYCVVYSKVKRETARIWNSHRTDVGQPSYPTTIMDDLLCRFEEPVNHNRWDSPLFEVDADESLDKAGEFAVPCLSPVIAYVLPESAAQPATENAMNDGMPGCRRSGQSNNLQPTIATQNRVASSNSRLYDMDRALQEVVLLVSEAQSNAGWHPSMEVPIAPNVPPIHLRRPMGLPELRRMKTSFLKLASHSSVMAAGPPSDAVSTKRMFAEHINRELGG